jgi:hypothetical protein
MKNTKTVSFSAVSELYKEARRLSRLAVENAQEAEESLISEAPTQSEAFPPANPHLFHQCERRAELAEQYGNLALKAVKNYRIQSWILENPSE